MGTKLAKVGRPRKSTRQKIIDGTFRHNEDGEKTDILYPIIEKVTAIKAPDSITDPKVKNHFETLIKNLLEVESLTWQDLALLEQAFLCLERANALKDELKHIEKIGIKENIKEYAMTIRAYRQALDGYSQIVYRFGVSPAERAKILRPAIIENGKAKLAEILKKA
jgi:phage terminase small subunit